MTVGSESLKTGNTGLFDCQFDVKRTFAEAGTLVFLSEQEEEAREFSLSRHSGAFKSGSIFQCFPGARSTELMTSIGKPTPHLAVFDPGIPIYNWRGNERGILQLFLLPGQFSLHRKLWA